MGTEGQAPAEGEAPPLALVKTITGKVVENGKVTAEYQVNGLPGDDGEFEFVFVAKAPSLDVSKQSAPMPVVIRKDQHVISVKLTAVGGTPFAGERVRVVDPDSNEVVAEVEADAEGRIVATVPEDKQYDLRIVDDDEGETADEPTEVDAAEADDDALLLLQFVDAAGRPIANEPVSLSGPSGEGDGRTDAEGKFEMSAEPGAYQARIRGKQVVVHTLFEDDRAVDGTPYRVVVA